MKAKKALATLFLVLTSSLSVFAETYPQGPIVQLTPGVLCNTPSTHRYPEKIAYCDRDVRYYLKEQVIENYDRRFGFNIKSLPREQFKIDHYIPLCMGGANDPANLWPQHKTVYSITDPLEEALCGKMAQGKLQQREAIEFIKEAKNHLDEVAGILAKVRSL